MNAIADAVSSRSKLGNVVTSCGGYDVECMNVVITVATYDVSVVNGPDLVSTDIADEHGCEGVMVTTEVCGYTDAPTLCGGVGST